MRIVGGLFGRQDIEGSIAWAAAIAGTGIVLYNIALSGLAIGLLILGLARPAPATS